MSSLENLRAENEQLRNQIEDYRRRELESLRAQLQVALSDVEHFRAEAARNAEVGRQIHRECQEEIRRLRDRISVMEQASGKRLRKIDE